MEGRIFENNDVREFGDYLMPSRMPFIGYTSFAFLRVSFEEIYIHIIQ